MTVRVRLLTAAAIVAGASIVTVATGGGGVVEAIDSVPNPLIKESCGVDLTLVLDASGSIASSHAVEQVRGAAKSFLDALADTDSNARVTQFGTASEELAPPTLITAASLSPGGAHADALTSYYNPKPPKPAGVTWYKYDGSGDPSNGGNFDQRTDPQYTNWDQSLRQAADTPAEIVVYITDGQPSAYDLDKPSDPFDQGPPSDVAFGTDRNQALQVTLDRAVEEANLVKTNKTRMLAVGVGKATSSNSLVQRLVSISGPQVVRDAGLGNVDSLNDIDVAIVSNFDDLAEFLRSVVLQLCSPSLTVTKLAQTPGSASYDPAPGWDITVTPEVPGGAVPPYAWILPDTAPAASKTVVTNGNGVSQFQWEPNPAEEDSRATIHEALQPSYIAGRPLTTDYRCELRDEKGNVRVQEGELDPGLKFGLDPIRQEVVTCSIWNSFDYQPAIELTKVNAPTEGRGDLSPPATVTSSYVVTNPGNTPLGSVTLTDNKCTPVEVPAGGPNTGDTNADGLLDPGEAWQFTCQQSITAAASTDPAGQTIVNSANTTGADPNGTVVTAQATDDVVAFNPAISIDKLVEGVKKVEVVPGTQVTYTYAVKNEGNTPLSPVTLTDDKQPCDTGITRLPDANGNGDDVLDVGEEWAYSCVAAPSATVVNTADVSGVPLNALAGSQPFPDPNPPVTATSQAEVGIVNADIELTKLADPNLLLLDQAGTPEPVTYNFSARNTGTADLVRPDGLDPKGDDWVTDPNCSPVSYVGGDTNSNDRIDHSPEEIWLFSCTTPVDQRTVNTADIVAQPTDTTGIPIPDARVTDTASAIVEVIRPDIAVAKTAVRSVVLDPDADAISGPDVPRRPAVYTYEVTNTGSVPLDLDPDPPTDNYCAPLTFRGGDTDADGLLDRTELWTYACETQLSRSDANNPPVTGGETGNVENTVSVTGVPWFKNQLVPDKSVTATTTANVAVIEPGIEITKTPSADIVVAGSDVTYTFVVSNVGDVALTVVGPNDDKCAPLVYVSGDTDGDGLLDGVNTTTESWTYTCTRSLGLPAPPALTDENTVEVRGVDPLGNTYLATAVAEVRVFAPAINLEKSVSETLVPAGTPVTYSFEVTNVGQSPLPADDVLAQIILVDVANPIQPSCATPTFVGGDVVNPGFLDRDPAEIWRYECIATIDDDTTNVAAVTGMGGTTFNPPLPIPVVDLAAASVQVFHPAIDVVKTAAPTELVGSGPVTYTYEVTNPGDVALADVAARITDDKCSPVTYVSGDLDNDGLLDTPTSIFEDAADETWIFTCTTTISETTKNTVVVTGTPTDAGGTDLCGQPSANRIDFPCDVTATAMANVVVTEPATIVIEKIASPDIDPQLFDFAIAGAGPPPTPTPSAFQLGDGDTQTFSGLTPGDYSVTETVPAGWDLALLSCADPTGDTTTDTDSGVSDIAAAAGETVTCTYTNVKLSAIVIVKETDPDGATDRFDFTFDDGSTTPFTLADGENRRFADLLPGTYSVAESVPSGWDLAGLVCIDPSGGTTTDPATGVADVDLAAGETVICTYSNTQRGSIRVAKIAEPGTDAAGTAYLFSFDVAGADPPPTPTPPNFQLGDGSSRTFQTLPPGDYTVTETIPAGWELADLVCVDPTNNTTVDVAAGLASITLDPGEVVDCVYSNVKLAAIIIDKVTDPSDSTESFDFTSSVAATPNFSLTNGQQQIIADLPPATYTVTELTESGWDLTDLTCIDPTGGTTTDPDTGIANVVLAAGDVVRCTYTNTQQGSIEIGKQTLPDGSNQSFDFELTGQNPFQLLDDGEAVFTGLAPGVYTATELATAGWDLTGLVCVDPTGDTTIDLDVGTATITLAAGETVRCDYTNTERGSIVIGKETLPDGANQTFDFTLTGQANFPLTDGAEATFTDLLPGDYSAAELIPAGWDLTDLVCVDPTGNTTIDLDTATASITLDPGETVSCDYTNTQSAVLIVAKQTDPDGSGELFDFAVTGEPGFELADDGSKILENLAPGSYTVTETVPDGWRLTALTCDDDAAVLDPDAGAAVVELGPGDVVRCDYTNTELGTVVVEKVTDPAGSQQEFDFDFDQQGFQLSDGENEAFSDLLPGNYAVAETLPVGWELSDLVCVDPSGGTVVDVDTGIAD
ncbi:MAG: hypothetical protein QNM02_02090, partial [Acidimicrobiia bacterium]|nr:hypothetical protein [Acidimicrobiia bacterium]